MILDITEKENSPEKTRCCLRTGKAKCIILLLLLNVGVLYGVCKLYERAVNLKCRDGFVLDEIFDIEYESPPPKDDSIFFHETSCNFDSNHIIHINPRQACAVESAAFNNPNSSIYLLYSAAGRLPNATEIDLYEHQLIKVLLKYKNIKIRRVNVKTYVENTPVEGWYENGTMQSSRYLQLHTNDMLKHITLWKYGGTYLDFDMVVLGNLTRLPKNSIGAEDALDVGGGIIRVSNDPYGHFFSRAFITETMKNWDKTYFLQSPPKSIITKTLQKICGGVYSTQQMSLQRCSGFFVFPDYVFYPIHWRYWKLYFDKFSVMSGLSAIKQAFTIRIWDEFSQDVKVDTTSSSTAYSVIASRNCPNVFRVTDVL